MFAPPRPLSLDKKETTISSRSSLSELATSNETKPPRPDGPPAFMSGEKEENPIRPTEGEAAHCRMDLAEGKMLDAKRLASIVNIERILYMWQVNS